jgi:hypothetical protein
MSDPTHASATGATSSSSSSSPAASKTPANKNPFEPPARSDNRSKGPQAAFTFDPPTLAFAGADTHEVTIRNRTAEPQTIDDWQLVGDSAAFQTTFVGSRSVSLEPGASLTFRIRFVSDDEKPQAAALIVSSTFTDHPARLNMLGTKRGQPQSGECSRVSISATTREGRPNSIQSAMRSVEGAWTAIHSMQERGINAIATIVNKELPKATPEWKTKLDGIIAQGLSKLIGGVSLYLGGGLALAAFDVLRSMEIAKNPVGEATAGAKEIANLTLKVHQGVTSSYAEGVLTKAATAVREAIEGRKETNPSAIMRESFFDAQVRTLSTAYSDAITTLNNSEGDFAALEANHPGLGFAALEAYRNHLSCHSGNVSELQRSATLGMWMSFLARLDVGTHEPEKWEQANTGAALEKNVYKSTDANHRLRDLARGVLELHVIWDYNRMKTRPVYELRRAHVSGINADLKELLTDAPIGHFSMPIIVHGKVKQDAVSGSKSSSHLRIGRNEGGAITLGAEPNTRSAEMLEQLGNGDSFAGARALFDHIDQMQLTKVE